MDSDVLVLNSNFEPLNVCTLRRAIALVYLGKAEVLHSNHRRIRTFYGEMPSPCVVKLRQHVRRPLPQLRLSRRGVFARDDHHCQYCGASTKELTIDHVVPRRLGGQSTWENLVTCCRRCNARKGDRALEQSGLRLHRLPHRPKFVPYISLSKYMTGLKNEVWRPYLPEVGGLAD